MKLFPTLFINEVTHWLTIPVHHINCSIVAHKCESFFKSSTSPKSALANQPLKGIGYLMIAASHGNHLLKRQQIILALPICYIRTHQQMPRTNDSLPHFIKHPACICLILTFSIHNQFIIHFSLICKEQQFQEYPFPMSSNFKRPHGCNKVLKVPKKNKSTLTNILGASFILPTCTNSSYQQLEEQLCSLSAMAHYYFES